MIVPFCCLAVGCVAFRPHAADPVPEAVDHLAAAAAALDRGDERGAASAFSAHLRDQPDDAMTRAQLAETLFKQRRWAEARVEFETYLADAQISTGPLRDNQLHALTRLMLIGAEEQDDFAESLHRGLGLYELVRSWDRDPARQDEPMANETLVKAVRALREARSRRPDSARVNLYLALAYERLGQLSAARSAWRGAASAPPLDLTPREAERLASHREQ